MMTRTTLYTILSIALGTALLPLAPSAAIAEQTGQADQGRIIRPEQCAAFAPPSNGEPAFESVQIETGNIDLYERFFERFLHTQPVFRMDHPLVDHIRAYCYRHALIVVRQDLKTPRPTGWVQVNFLVQDVETIQRDLEEAGLSLESTEQGVRENPFPIRLKRMVPRNHCRVDRLEVSGPEGFMIGFHQIHKETCRPPAINDDPRQ
jgi:hypothetical protein